MASTAITASWHMGRNTPTASLTPTPRCPNALASRPTSWASSAYVSVRTAPSSASEMTATASRREPVKCLSTQFAARFVVPSTNQRGHCMPRDMSTTCRYGVNQSHPRSRETASQYHAMSSTERCCRAASEAHPCCCMKRAMRVREAVSGSGRQTMSGKSMGNYSSMLGAKAMQG